MQRTISQMCNQARTPEEDCSSPQQYSCRWIVRYAWTDNCETGNGQNFFWNLKIERPIETIRVANQQYMCEPEWQHCTEQKSNWKLTFRLVKTRAKECEHAEDDEVTVQSLQGAD